MSTRASASLNTSTNRTTLQDRVVAAIGSALRLLDSAIEPPAIKLEYARDEQFGDYATTVAMDKEFRQLYSEKQPDFRNPRNFASALAGRLAERKELFARVEVAGPGFINLTLDAALLYDSLGSAIEAGADYGKSQSAEPKSILFEFVSANPTGPLNVVSARAAALGDSCCNLLAAIGHRPYREFYVNDYGNQVALLGQSVLLRHLESEGVVLNFAERDDSVPRYVDRAGLPFPAEGYHGDYLSDVARAVAAGLPGAEESALASLIDSAKELATKLASDATLREEIIGCGTIASLGAEAERLAQTFSLGALNHFLTTQKRDLQRFRVDYDNFYSERSLHDSGAVLKVRQRLESHIEREQSGREIFQSSRFGDDKDRVIVREDGRPTYLLADIAYHETKLSRGFDQIFNIWGPDHHGYIKRLAAAMELLGADQSRFRVLIAQQVNLLENGQPMVMSKRAGKLVTMAALLDEIPIDVLRYYFVMRSFEAHLDFDLAEARDTSEKNPYYYIAYAHARICSIYRKAEELGLTTEVAKLRDSRATTPLHEVAAAVGVEMTVERRRLLWLAARFPDEVRDAGRALEPHRLLNYIYSFASALTKFYSQKENRIIEQPPERAALLLLMLDGVALSLRNGLQLLGMEAPERLYREGGDDA